MNRKAKQEPNWAWYRTFLHVLESGSLSAAGRAMGLGQPTVGRHIDSLEAALGLTLFTRSFDGFAPTEAAIELRPYAGDIAATAAALLRAAGSQGSAIRGSVRISASEVIGVEVLPPILAALREEHPDLVVELLLSDQADDLLHRKADIAVRMFRPEQDALVAKHIGGVEVGFFAQQGYLARRGMPETMEDLSRHALIGFDREDAFIRRIVEMFPVLSRSGLVFRADNSLAQMAAVRAGIGIGIFQTHLAAREAGLVRVLPQAFSLVMETWVAMHENLRGSPRCAVCFAALVAGLTAYVERN